MSISRQRGFSLMSVVVAWVLCGSAVLSAYQIIRVAQQQIVQTHNHSVAVVLLPTRQRA